MRHALLGAIAGLVLGVSLGCLLAFLLRPTAEADEGWTSYPTLTSPATPTLSQEKKSDPPHRWFYFIGALLGGGFGCLGGAVVGATWAITAALRPR